MTKLMTEGELNRLLDSEAPEYGLIAELDEAAVSFLSRVIGGHESDAFLTSKAVQAASRDRGPWRGLSEAFVFAAASSGEPSVRVAAAGAASNLSAESRDAVLAVLKDDPHPEVQKVAARTAGGAPAL